MAIELVRITDLLRRANKNSQSNAVDLKKLRGELAEKEKAAEAALEEADKAVSAAEEVRLKLAAEVAKEDEANSEVETLTEETTEQKIARLEKELADIKRIQDLEEKLAAEKAEAKVEVVETTTTTTTTKAITPKPTAKVEAEKLNVTTAPKVEVTTEVYEPEAPKSGAKGAATRRK